MKTISGIVYLVHAVVAIPLALLVPPLLKYRHRRKLGGPIYLSKPQAVGGLVVWFLLLPLLGWLAWPTIRSWAKPTTNQVRWPADQGPGHVLPEQPEEL